MNERRRIIADAWADYRQKVVPAVAGPTQVDSTRMAFYAGALTLFNGLITSLGTGDEIQEQDLDMMDAVKLELDEFAADAVRRGGHRA
ncbi:MAG TPA: hypothetical protein VFG69_15265 [Nannocystaceae bacterium]|nr:hypothetical protein [Nannocystaceae bacterium]